MSLSEFRWRFTVVIIAMMLVNSALISEGADSFLVNGSFEDGAADDVPGWFRSFYPQSDESIGDCISRSNQRARSGDWSLRIDTEPILGKEVTLVFNNAIAEESARIQGQQLVLSGWIYVEPGTAPRTIGMRLRIFDRDDEGKSVYLDDVLSLKILGKSGKWTQFEASGTVPHSDVASMDLHCSTRPDVLPTVQFLDDLRLEAFVPPSLEIQILRDALWRDEEALPVDTQLNMESKDAKSIVFRLMDDQGVPLAEWNRPAQTAIFGLPLPEKLLPQGSYILRCELQDREGDMLESTEASLEIASSPWEGTPKKIPQTTLMRDTDEAPEGFRVMGTVAQTSASDVVPPQPEAISPDLDLSLWQNTGYAVFSRHYLEKVSRLGRPRPGEFGSIRIFACPGEYEPMTLSVWAMQPQKDVRLTVSDLNSENGRISSDNIDVRIVRTVPGLPSFLEKRITVDIPKDETLTYWLTVRVPPDSAPGFYRGSIKIAAGNSDPTHVELLLRVLPLNLPPPPKGYGFWWKMDTRWNGYYSKERDEALEQVRKQFVMLREHGCNMLSCYGMPKMTRDEGKPITFSFEQDHWGYSTSLADFFRLGRETGFLLPNVPIQYTGADSLHSNWIARFAGFDAESKAFDDFYRDTCRRIDGWAKEQGFRLAFACIDEIGNSSERRQDALRFYRIAREAGALTSVTDNSMHGGVHLMGQSRFDDIIDMRLYNFITPEMIEHTQQSGDVLWLYNMASGGRNAMRDRFVFGLFTERCGAAGYSQWAFQWPSGNVNPYEAAMAGKRSGYHYALPAPDGPLPTAALEGVREGIDDARYLAYLRQRNPGAEAAFLDDIEPFSTQIREYLDNRCGNFLDVKRWKIAKQAMEAK